MTELWHRSCSSYMYRVYLLHMIRIRPKRMRATRSAMRVSDVREGSARLQTGDAYIPHPERKGRVTVVDGTHPTKPRWIDQITEYICGKLTTLLSSSFNSSAHYLAWRYRPFKQAYNWSTVITHRSPSLKMASTSDVERPPSSQPRELPPPAYDAAMTQPSFLPIHPFSQQVNKLLSSLCCTADVWLI